MDDKLEGSSPLSKQTDKSANTPLGANHTSGKLANPPLSPKESSPLSSKETDDKSANTSSANHSNGKLTTTPLKRTEKEFGQYTPPSAKRALYASPLQSPSQSPSSTVVNGKCKTLS